MEHLLKAPDFRTDEQRNSDDVDREILQLVLRIKHLSEESDNDIAYTKLQKIRDLADALIPRLEEARDIQREKSA